MDIRTLYFSLFGDNSISSSVDIQVDFFKMDRVSGDGFVTLVISM